MHQGLAGSSSFAQTELREGSDWVVEVECVAFGIVLVVIARIGCQFNLHVLTDFDQSVRHTFFFCVKFSSPASPSQQFSTMSNAFRIYSLLAYLINLS